MLHSIIFFSNVNNYFLYETRKLLNTQVSLIFTLKMKYDKLKQYKKKNFPLYLIITTSQKKN